MAVALLLATTVLLYRAKGFGLDKDGRVIQNGLVFVSSQPNGANIFLNGQKYKSATSTRIVLPGGQYTTELTRTGYRTWKRAITVEGGSVERFDYPVLFPQKLVTTVTKQYAAAPLLETQSLDQRWLITQALAPDQFDLYDLNASKPVPKPLTVPSEILTPATTTQGWEAVEWAGDNRHVVLSRSYQKDGQPAKEYILFDRQDPTQSKNLTVAFGFNPTTIELTNHKYNAYYLYDASNSQLFTATLAEPTPQPYLANVLAFSTDQTDVLYATTADAPAGSALIKLRQGNDTYIVRREPLGTTYLLDLARYRGKPFVAAGAQSDNKVYVYKDPAGVLSDDPKAVLVPLQILKVERPTSLSHAPAARFFALEAADFFAVYDAETNKAYAFQAKSLPDAPQTRATWMDGYHLQLVSSGTLRVFDFDGANPQTLSPAAPAFTPVFDPNFHFLYAITAAHALTSTALLAPQDQ